MGAQSHHHTIKLYFSTHHKRKDHRSTITPSKTNKPNYIVCCHHTVEENKYQLDPTLVQESLGPHITVIKHSEN